MNWKLGYDSGTTPSRYALNWKLGYDSGTTPSRYALNWKLGYDSGTTLSRYALNWKLGYESTLTIELVSDCCLTSTQQFLSYIIARTCDYSMRWWWGPLYAIPACLVRFL
jgi:hypothetical protein